jgi:prefoldin subunit 5
MKNEFENRIYDAVGDIDNVADSIRNWTETAVSKSTGSIDGFFENIGEGIGEANKWIEDTAGNANDFLDNITEKVENAKIELEEKIDRVKQIFENLQNKFDESFGFINGKNFAEETFMNISNTAIEKMDGAVFDEIGELSKDIANFIKNFNIGKVVTSIGGIVVGAGAATVAMDLLPSIDIDKMLKNIIGKIEDGVIDKIAELYSNKYNDEGIDLLEIPDVPWRLSKDDLEKYNADGYNKYLEDFAEFNNNVRSKIIEQMMKVNSLSDLASVSKENREEMKENKSALKAMRKVRRDAIKARMVERYKGFLKTELEYLKKECLNMKDNIKYEWDSMMYQYKAAAKEIQKFFTKEGYGGCEAIDRCCDKINDDAEQIVELCKSITVEITNAVTKVPIPYAIGTCVDMPVHKILTFFVDIKIIITFLKNLIRLGIDIISQLTILAKIIAGSLENVGQIIKTLKEILGIDTILKMIDYLVELFRPKMIDAKILLENAISPVYYNETEDYEERVEAMERLLTDEDKEGKEIDGGEVEKFRYTDDIYGKKYNAVPDFGGKATSDDEIQTWLEELEAKGEREIVAYRSPILNAEGDDFAGWIFYHADAYDNMHDGWTDNKKRRRNRVIKKASKKNKMVLGKLVGGVAQLKKNMSFGNYNDSGEYIKNSVNGFDAYYWYTKWTNDPTDCVPDLNNREIIYDDEGKPIGTKVINYNVVVPIQTTANGSLVELADGRRVFVEGKIVRSGDFVNVNGVKYKVK